MHGHEQTPVLDRPEEAQRLPEHTHAHHAGAALLGGEVTIDSSYVEAGIQDIEDLLTDVAPKAPDTRIHDIEAAHAAAMAEEVNRAHAEAIIEEIDRAHEAAIQEDKERTEEIARQAAEAEAEEIKAEAAKQDELAEDKPAVQPIAQRPTLEDSLQGQDVEEQAKLILKSLNLAPEIPLLSTVQKDPTSNKIFIISEGGVQILAPKPEGGYIVTKYDVDKEHGVVTITSEGEMTILKKQEGTYVASDPNKVERSIVLPPIVADMVDFDRAVAVNA